MRFYGNYYDLGGDVLLQAAVPTVGAERWRFGADNRVRTDDLVITNQ
jgi:hypothetical protein